MRKFLPERITIEQETERRLRTGKPAGIYARRSDPTAKDKKKDKSQSREMQTDDLIAWGGVQGWLKTLLHPYFADLGLSGTLRPDQRPDMLRLFDDIDAGKFDDGSIICFQENRLFRDETQIYYNQFIDKCLQHNIHVVVISPRLTIYDLRDDMLKEMLRAKLKEAAEFIPQQIKGWLHPARERAAWVYGEWAGLGSLPPGFIVDRDPDSPTYKKPVPYWPHIEKNKETFQLFMELGGDISLFYNRLRTTPIVYPEFESWVDQETVKAFRLSKYPGGGYHIKTRSSLINLLTTPLHYGYRSIKGVIRRDSQGNKIREFEPVIDLELLDFAYSHLATTDFDGNPILNDRPRRYFQKDSDDQVGLLKFRIQSPQGEVRTRPYQNSPRKVYYLIAKPQPPDEYLYQEVPVAVIHSEEIDNLIVKRLMEHVREVNKKRESVETYQEQVKTERQRRQSKVKQLEKSIKDIEIEQTRLTTRLGTNEEEQEESQKKKPSERVVELILERIDTLEEERQRLVQAIEELQEEMANDFGSLDEELESLETLWPDYPFERRRTLINFVVREVVIENMSTHWVRVQVLWLHEDWGRDEMFYYRNRGKRQEWTTEEDEIIMENYTTKSPRELMCLLPERAWGGIRQRSTRLPVTHRKVGRSENAAGTYKLLNYSHNDLIFMEEHQIDLMSLDTKWMRQLAQSKTISVKSSTN